jgi:hypothetical protein
MGAGVQESMYRLVGRVLVDALQRALDPDVNFYYNCD